MDRFFRKCCFCQFHTLNKTILCDHCWDQLQYTISFESGVFESENIKVFSLFKFEEGRNKHLIMKLKGGGVRSTFFELAKITIKFAQIHEAMPNLNKNTILVPIPSKRFLEDENHSFCLTRELSALIGVNVKDVLQIPKLTKTTESTFEYKEKNKKEREKREFILNERITFSFELNQPISILFIDDIVTSGATLRAAQKAIVNYSKHRFGFENHKIQFYFWTLGRTPKQF